MSARFGLLGAIAAIIFMASLLRAEIILIPDQYTTIQAGVDASNNGDTVIVRAGRYREIIDFGGHSILLASFYLATLDTSYISQTIIDGGGTGSVLTLESGEATTIVGFTITGGAGSEGAGLLCIGAVPVVRRNYITSNDGPGIYCQNASALFYNNMISNNTGSGIILDHCPYPIVEGNLIFRNTTSGQGGGIKSMGSSFALNRNTITANSASGGGAIYARDTSMVTLTNNILWEDNAPQGPELSMDDDSYIGVTYSDIQGGWSGEGNIDADPMFCSPFYHNYYLARHSPCVSSGENGVNMGALDIGCEQVGIEPTDKIPEDYFLAGSYPNPFNSSCTIYFGLSYPSHVKVDIFDIGGRQAESLINGNFAAGLHQIYWDASRLPSGLYFARLKAGGNRRSMKLILMK